MCFELFYLVKIMKLRFSQHDHQLASDSRASILGSRPGLIKVINVSVSGSHQSTAHLVLFVCGDHVVNPLVSVQHQHRSGQFALLLVYQPVFIRLVEALYGDIVIRIN